MIHQTNYTLGELMEFLNQFYQISKDADKIDHALKFLDVMMWVRNLSEETQMLRAAMDDRIKWSSMVHPAAREKEEGEQNNDT